MVNDLRQPVVLKSLELRLVLQLQRLLESGSLKLVAESGKALELPPDLHDVLKQVVEQMAEGRTVILTRGEKVVTTQQAAAMLGMSRPTFIKCLESGLIPHHRVGNQRRVLLRDLLNYLRLRDGSRWAERMELDLALERLEKSGLPVSWAREPVMGEDRPVEEKT
jgi:excisionase family DNA binding protein